MPVMMPDVLGQVRARSGWPAPARQGTDATLVRVAWLAAFDDSAFTATISLLDSEPIEGVPAVPGTYVGVTAVYVQVQGGRPVLVTGPASVAEAGGGVVPEPPPVVGPVTRTVTGRVVSPVGSGTWRATRAAWDRWNHATDVYQAGSPASGALAGLAWFGSRVVDLRATSIQRATLRVTASGNPGAGPWSMTVQGSSAGARPPGAPSFTGDTTTLTVPGHHGGTTQHDLPAGMREALRTGATRSLGPVGATYGGTIGTRGGAAMWSLTLDYTVTD